MISVISVALVTPKPLWRHKGIVIHVTGITIKKVSIVRNSTRASIGTSLANFGLLIKTNQLISL